MIIQYTPDLTKQIFAENADSLRRLGLRVDGEGNFMLGEIDNPAVAWDGQRISGLSNGELISYLFGNPEIRNISVYDDMPNEWFRLDGTWPVTIDTVTHLRGQGESLALKTAQKVLDVGCGNGIAGIYAVNKNHGIQEVTFSDIQKSAVETTKQNAIQFSKRSDVRGSLSVFDAIPQNSEKYDVIIASAVPATPSYPGLQRQLNHLFEGTAFLEKLLRDAPAHLNEGGKLILSHSSCGEPEFQDIAGKYGANVDKILYERQNAYRVEFLNDPNWVNFLVERGGLTKKQDRGFDYWHTVKVKEISYS